MNIISHISRCVRWTLPVALSASAASAATQPAELPSVYTSWRTMTTRDGLPHDRIQALRVSGGEMWVGTEGGLALWQDRTWKTWTKSDGLPTPLISAIDVDPRTRDVWLGTIGGGLVRFSAGRFDQFTQFKSGLAGDVVFAVAVEEHRVWAATNGGLSAYDLLNDHWEGYLERRADGPETAVTHLVAWRGRLYCGTWCEGLRSFDLARGAWTAWASSGPAGNWRGLTRTSDDTTAGIDRVGHALWWVTQRSVHRCQETGAFQTRSVELGSSSEESIHCLAARSPTEVWLGTEAGLHVLADWNTGMWVSYEPGRAAAPGRVIAQREGQQVGVLSLASMLPEFRIQCIAHDREGVWVGTAGGLARGSECTAWNQAGSAAIADSPGVEGFTEAADTNGGTDAPSHPSPVVLAVLGPFGKTISVPATASAPARITCRADLVAVEIAAGLSNVRDDSSWVPVRVEKTGIGFSGYGWRLPEDDLAYFARQPETVAAVGSLRAASRTTSFTALRLGLPLINASADRPTSDETLNPWVFRCRSHDPRVHEALLDYLFETLGRTRVAIIRTPGVLARLHLDWWADHARRRALAPLVDLTFDPSHSDPRALLAELHRCDPTVVLTWCDAELSAVLLRCLRDDGLTPLFVGSDQIVRDDFADLIGREPGEVMALDPCEHRRDSELAARFAQKYAGQSSAGPQRVPLEAYLSFDAAQHAMEAIRAAGPKREAVRSALQQRRQGVAARLLEGEWTRTPVTIRSWEPDTSERTAPSAQARTPANVSARLTAEGERG